VIAQHSTWCFTRQNFPMNEAQWVRPTLSSEGSSTSKAPLAFEVSVARLALHKESGGRMNQAPCATRGLEGGNFAAAMLGLPVGTLSFAGNVYRAARLHRGPRLSRRIVFVCVFLLFEMFKAHLEAPPPSPRPPPGVNLGKANRYIHTDSNVAFLVLLAD